MKSYRKYTKKEGRKKLNYDVQTYSISATISNGQNQTEAVVHGL